MSPERAANSKAVLPPISIWSREIPRDADPAERFPPMLNTRRFVTDRACRSASWARRLLVTLGWEFAAAHISADWNRVPSVRFTAAPAARRASIASRPPAREAAISAVSPLSRVRLGSAPAARSCSTSGPCPRPLAIRSGVTARSFAALTSAPASTKRRTMVRFSRWTAQCRGVDPSGCAIFTSTDWVSNDRRVSASWYRTASINRSGSLWLPACTRVRMHIQTRTNGVVLAERTLLGRAIDLQIQIRLGRWHALKAVVGLGVR